VESEQLASIFRRIVAAAHPGGDEMDLTELPFRMTFVATQRSSVGGMTSEPTTICPEHHIAEFIHECCREVPINHPNSRIARHDI
jgi:hypothetical protein